MKLVYWKVGPNPPYQDATGAAKVPIYAVDDDRKLYGEGDVRVTEHGRLATTLPRGEGSPDLPDSLRGAVGFALGGLESLREVVARAARSAALIPAADPARAITYEPRILELRQGGACGEGCVVVIDDPGAVVASGRYHGPPGPPNLDHVRSPASLPGRQYLQVSVRTTTRYTLSAQAPTVFPSWETAYEAICGAQGQGLFRAAPPPQPVPCVDPGHGPT